jgi:glycine/D-amino acid oxidase-like deaminating enzyme
MARLRLGHSYWLDVSRGRAPRLPSLRGRHTADIAIVGGGVTGCAAALLLARAGARVVLVESQRIGRGSTAASTALLMQEPDVDFADLAERYGPAVARRMWACSRGAVTSMRRTLASLGVTSLHSLPSLYYTRDATDARALRREASLRRRAGFPATSLDPARVQELAGFEAAGGILTTGNAQVDPYEACTALARAARAAGARLYEHSPVTRIAGTRDGVTMTLASGEIAADWAIVATGYATPEFKPLAGRFRMLNTYVIATPRLSTSDRLALGLGDVMVWDTGRPYHYLRWTSDDRLLFGGLDRPQVPTAIRPAALRKKAVRLTRDLIDLYPSLAGLEPAYAWEGLFAMTPDGLPYVGPHRRYPRQLFALGYGGNGMTLGYFAAQALVRLAQGKPKADDKLFGFGRWPRPSGTRGARG